MMLLGGGLPLIKVTLLLCWGVCACFIDGLSAIIIVESCDGVGVTIEPSGTAEWILYELYQGLSTMCCLPKPDHPKYEYNLIFL